MAERVTHPNQFRVYKPSADQRTWLRFCALVWLVYPNIYLVMALSTESLLEVISVFIEFAVGNPILALGWSAVLAFTMSRAVYLWNAAGCMRIVFSDEVIEFYTFGYSIIGSWRNIEKITQLSRGRQSTEAILFTRCTSFGSPLWILLAMGNRQFYRAIPIGDFGDWRKQEVALELVSCLPNNVPLVPAIDKSQIFTEKEREEQAIDRLEDFFESLSYPTKRRLPRR